MLNIGRKLAVLALATLPQMTCVPGESPWSVDPTDTVGEQVSAATPEGTACHAGKFECAYGPDTAECGTWYFDMTESETVVGYGELAGPNGTISLTLSGAIDRNVPSFPLTLTSEAGGSGQMTISYSGPELEIVGSWSFTDAPEPAGVLIEGGVTGASCTDLR